MSESLCLNYLKILVVDVVIAVRIRNRVNVGLDTLAEKTAVRKLHIEKSLELFSVCTALSDSLSDLCVHIRGDEKSRMLLLGIYGGSIPSGRADCHKILCVSNEHQSVVAGVVLMVLVVRAHKAVKLLALGGELCNELVDILLVVLSVCLVRDAVELYKLRYVICKSVCLGDGESVNNGELAVGNELGDKSGECLLVSDIGAGVNSEYAVVEGVCPVIILGRFGVYRVKERSCGLCSRMIRKTEDYSVLRIANCSRRADVGDACAIKQSGKCLCLVGQTGAVYDNRLVGSCGVKDVNALARGSPSRSVGVTGAGLIAGAGCRIITVIKSGDVEGKVKG